MKKRQQLETDDTPEIGICMCLRRLEKRMCLRTLTAWRKYNSVFDNNEILPNTPMDVLVKWKVFFLSIGSVRCSILSTCVVCNVRATHHCCDNPIGMCLNVIFTCALINYHITFNYLLSHHSDNKKRTNHPCKCYTMEWWMGGERERVKGRKANTFAALISIQQTP